MSFFSVLFLTIIDLNSVSINSQQNFSKTDSTQFLIMIVRTDLIFGLKKAPIFILFAFRKFRQGDFCICNYTDTNTSIIGITKSTF